jgi:hypothetical protein
MADVEGMDENLIDEASRRIPGEQASVGRGSNPAANPGQNDRFSDGFPTKEPVDACLSAKPGETTDPQNPMKSTIDPPSAGLPPDPPLQISP